MIAIRRLSVLLPIIAVVGLGCGPETPKRTYGVPSVPVGGGPINIPGIPKEPALTPEAAIEQYGEVVRNGDLDNYIALLAEPLRVPMNELVKVNEQCRDTETALGSVLDPHFGLGEEPLVFITRTFDPPSKLIESLYTFEISASKAKNENEVELTVRSSIPMFGDNLAKTGTFVAIKENDGWKLNPPGLSDFIALKNELERVTAAKTKIIADVESGKLKSRKVAMNELVKALLRRKAQPGTPEEAIEIQEAAKLAGDYDTYSGILSRDLRQAVDEMMATSRRSHNAYKGYYEAMNERFGYERTSAFFLQPFSAASGLFGPIERNEIISREVKNETRVHLKLKRTVWSGAYVNPVEVVESVAKEDGEWRIDTNADSLKATDAQKNWIVHQVTDIELL